MGDERATRAEALWGGGVMIPNSSSSGRAVSIV